MHTGLYPVVLGLVTVAIFLQKPSSAQETRGCGSPEAADFDFWIGDWRIEQKILRQDGSWLPLEARTSVSATLDGCALIEHWEGEVQFFWEGMSQPELMKGLSVRAFDAEAGVWSIHWMDSRTPRFGTPYRGRFQDDRGEFFRNWVSPQGERKGRITFSDINPDSVRWDLAVSSDDGQSWTTLWIMNMYRIR